MEADSNKYCTQLTDRTLWYDGTSTVTIDQLIDLMMQGVSTEHLYIDQVDDQIKQFNKNVDKKQKLTEKTQVQLPQTIEWNIPEHYKHLNVYKWTIEQLMDFFNQHSIVDDQTQYMYASRCTMEYQLFKRYQLLDVFRTLIYVINTFESNDVVWGVGRGSSVASFLLYLAGVHDIDSVYYQLDIEEFLSEGK